MRQDILTRYCIASIVSIHTASYQYSNIVLLSNSNFGRVYLSIKKRRGCHGDAKRWHLHIYIAKRPNVIIYSCHLAIFVKGSVLTRSNSLVSHLGPKWAALKCFFFALMKAKNAWSAHGMANPPWNKGPVQSTSTSISYARKRYLFMWLFV